jgi:hypothetical protein
LTSGWVARRYTPARTRYPFGPKVEDANRLILAAEPLVTDLLLTDYFAPPLPLTKLFYPPPLTNINPWPLLN